MNYALLFTAFGVFIAASDACSCVPMTKQDAYCRASWITRARVVSSQNLGNSIEYTIQNNQIFKSHTSLLPNKVFTPSSSAACGVTNLVVGNEYLLAGSVNSGTGALQLNSCLYMPADDYMTNGIPQWSSVPAELNQQLQSKSITCPTTSGSG